MPTDAQLTETRHALHAVAELVLAGSQYAACSRIALQVVPGGFATRYDPEVRVEGGEVLAGDGRVAIDGRTSRAIAAELGLPLRLLDDVYTDGAGYGPDEVLHVDGDAAAALAAAWSAGHEALVEVAPGANPILWPEHFDVGISVGEVNLGGSPGDGFMPVPYAYVGPWQVPEDPWFDAPFGAARAVSELGDAAGIAAFFREGLGKL
ncbi:MAG: hypothetical protein ACJ72E_17130 [Marmoricola sp.]